VGNLRSDEQELPARLSTDADPHRLLLLLQERHAANRPITLSSFNVVGQLRNSNIAERCYCFAN